MASWHYVFMFAGPTESLQPEGALDVIFQAGFDFDDLLRQATIIDSAGHLEYTGEIKFSGLPYQELSTRLKRHEQFQIEGRNQELFLSISFATAYANPYIMIGCSRKIFAGLSKSSQSQYFLWLRQFAKLCRAAYVIVVDDPPDYFEDKFIDVDGRRFLDDRMPSGRPYEIHSIWVDKSIGGSCPEGLPDFSEKNIGDGFTSFQMQKKSLTPRP